MSFPLSLFAYPFYLMSRSPGKEGSHFDPKCNLFSPAEGKLVRLCCLSEVLAASSGQHQGHDHLHQRIFRVPNASKRPGVVRLTSCSSHVQIQTSNKFFAGMLAVLAACTVALGPLAMLKLYVVPYWINVVWLDAVTYLHHHGPDDENIKVPWYRGEVCSCDSCRHEDGSWCRQPHYLFMW